MAANGGAALNFFRWLCLNGHVKWLAGLEARLRHAQCRVRQRGIRMLAHGEHGYEAGPYLRGCEAEELELLKFRSRISAALTAWRGIPRQYLIP